MDDGMGQEGCSGGNGTPAHDTPCRTLGRGALRQIESSEGGPVDVVHPRPICVHISPVDVVIPRVSRTQTLTSGNSTTLSFSVDFTSRPGLLPAPPLLHPSDDCPCRVSHPSLQLNLSKVTPNR